MEVTAPKTNLDEAIGHITINAIVGITTETPVTLTGGKKNPLQGRVVKRLLSGNVILFCNRESNGYENMVRRRLEKEGISADNFTLGERKWGNRIKGTPYVAHKGNLYLETIFLSKPTKIEYLVDGKVTDKKDIIGLPEKKQEGEQGGLINSVIVRDYKTENIKAIRVNGKEFTF
jgi:hypothetical protein